MSEKAVDPFETEIHTLSHCQGRCRKRTAVAPLEGLPGLQEIDVAVQFGLLDQPGALQVQFDIAGDGGCHGPEGDAVHLLRPADRGLALLPIVQSPFPVKGNRLGCQGESDAQR